MLNIKYDNIKGIKKNKTGSYYVSNPILLEEMIKSKNNNELTNDAVIMLTLLCENLSKKMYYKDPEYREDCISNAILDCLQYWRNFDPEKSKNPFAYFTSVATNGFAKQWRCLGKMKFPDSIMTSLSDENVFSI